LGLVGAVCIDGELSREFSCWGVDDADVEVVGEDGDVGSGVGPADSDVVHSSLDAQCNAAGVVDAIAAQSFVCVGGA
jgi:hypothetical protein